MDATAALRDAHTFPADDLRQQHLGFLLAWLRTKGGRVKREAAAEQAERESVSTSLDPKIERDDLEPLVDSYRDARRPENKRAMRVAEKSISEVLSSELRRRLDLCADAIAFLRSEKRGTNPGVSELAKLGRDEFVYGYLRGERPRPSGQPPFVPSPETDRHAAGAASEYLKHIFSAELQAGALIHHDQELQAEAIAAGDAFRGTVVTVEDRAPKGSRGKTPVWTVEAPGNGPMRVREGSWVCVAGIPSRSGVIRSVASSDAGGRRIEVEITGWKQARPTDPKFPGLLAAHDEAHEGSDVTFLPTSSSRLSERKRFLVWESDGPGAWLTHGKAAQPHAGKHDGTDFLAEVEGLRGGS